MGFVFPFIFSAALAATSLPTPRLVQIPVIYQSTDFSCGAAALVSALGYYGIEINETQMMTELKTTPEKGTKIDAMAAFARKKGLKATIRTGLDVADLIPALHQRQLSIVEVQAWSEKPVNYTEHWDAGHYLVVIGMDKSHLYFLDPAMLGGWGTLTHSEFKKRWHDVSVGGKRLHHTALFLEGTPKPPSPWQAIP